MDKTKQGDIGVIAAKFHYAIEGVATSTPNSERLKYDLVGDFDGVLKRIQVKTSSWKPSGKYRVQLRTNGANYTTKNNITKISDQEIDIVFILTGDGKCYEIPAEVISGMSELTMGEKYDKYMVRWFGGITVFKSAALV